MPITKPGTLLLCVVLSLLFSMQSRVVAQSWSISTPFDHNTEARELVFATGGKGYVWGRHHTTSISDTELALGVLFRTIDSGVTWLKPSRLAPPLDFEPVGGFVCVIDTEAVYLINDGDGLQSVLRSLDGGFSWVYDTPDRGIRRYAAMFSRSTGIFDTDSGDAATYMTYDSAKTLGDPRNGGEYADWRGIGQSTIRGDWADTSHWCYALARDVHDGGTMELPIVVTTNGGRFWKNVIPDSSIGHNVHYRNTAYLKGTPNVWVVADDTSVSYYRSSDYGLTWKGYTAYAKQIKQIVPVTPTEAWALTDAKNSKGTVTTSLLHTTDAGETWSVDSTTFKGYWPSSLFFLDPHHGWALLGKGDSVLFVARYTSPDTPRSNVNLAAVRATTQKLTAYPDPVGSYLNIPFPPSDRLSTLTTLDMAAREIQVFHRYDHGTITLHVPTLVAGAYSIQLIGTSGTRYDCRFTKK